MILGVDASTIRTGGGFTHLQKILQHINPNFCPFKKIIVWSSQKTLDKLQLENQHNPSLIEYQTHSLLNKSIFHCLFWQINFHKSKNIACDILLVTGGSHYSKFKPYVTIVQNLLPFEWHEAKRYGPSKALLRILLLSIIQKNTLKKANGVIFLTNHTKNLLAEKYKLKNTTCIPHGTNHTTNLCVYQKKLTKDYNPSSPFKIVYVSIIDVYKHQTEVISAVSKLRNQGLPLTLELVGDYYAPSLKKLKKSLKLHDQNRKFITYSGKKPNDDLRKIYSGADLFVFASTCEAFGIILLEAMEHGLPIICSDRPTLRETLKDCGLYCNPESPHDISEKIKLMFYDQELRAIYSQKAYKRSHEYSWSSCATNTYNYIHHILKKASEN